VGLSAKNSLQKYLNSTKRGRYDRTNNGSFHYSQASRSKLSQVFTCPQIFIIIILKQKGVMQTNI